MPPPMKLSKEMVEAMGGISSEHHQEFRKQCYTAFLHLRRHANVMLNLFSLMVDASVPDIALEPDKAVKKVEENLKLGLTDEEAVHYLQGLLDLSIRSVMPALVDQIHKFAQYWRNWKDFHLVNNVINEHSHVWNKNREEIENYQKNFQFYAFHYRPVLLNNKNFQCQYTACYILVRVYRNPRPMANLKILVFIPVRKVLVLWVHSFVCNFSSQSPVCHHDSSFKNSFMSRHECEKKDSVRRLTNSRYSFWVVLF